jgi:protein associated with RNAse G/E
MIQTLILLGLFVGVSFSSKNKQQQNIIILISNLSLVNISRSKTLVTAKTHVTYFFLDNKMNKPGSIITLNLAPT